MRTLPVLRRVVGVVLLVLIGLLHLVLVKNGLHLQMYLGILFILDTALSFVSALWIALSNAPLGWTLGAIAAAGSFVGYMVTRTVALPGLHILPWNAPFGLLSLVIEALAFVLIVSALTRRKPVSVNTV
ncbi:MAG: hypothetical protein NVSMB49_11730 [Ktedonobacteraceae bacterium]